MSGGHWNWKDRQVVNFFVEGVEADSDDWLDTLQDRETQANFPAITRAAYRFGKALDDVLHDMDWHLSGDTGIEDIDKFEEKAIKKMIKALKGKYYSGK